MCLQLPRAALVLHASAFSLISTNITERPLLYCEDLHNKLLSFTLHYYWPYCGLFCHTMTLSVCCAGITCTGSIAHSTRGCGFFFFTLACYSVTNRLPFVKHILEQNAANQIRITVKDQGRRATFFTLILQCHREGTVTYST